jgi:hypothetical protein
LEQLTKLSDLGKSIPVEPPIPVADESEHFYTCRHCGQIVDRQDLNQVIWHEMPRHTPLEMDG